MTHYCRIWSPLTGKVQAVCGRFFPVGPDGPRVSQFEVNCRECIEEHDVEAAEYAVGCNHLGSSCDNLGMAAFTVWMSTKDWSPRKRRAVNSQNG